MTQQQRMMLLLALVAEGVAVAVAVAVAAGSALATRNSAQQSTCGGQTGRVKGPALVTWCETSIHTCVSVSKCIQWITEGKTNTADPKK